MSSNVNSQHRIPDTTSSQLGQGISGNENRKPPDSGQSGRTDGLEKKPRETRYDATNRGPGYGRADKYEKHASETHAWPNPKDSSVTDTQTSAYAQPTGKRREKIDNPSPEVKSRAAHDDDDFIRSTRAENGISDDAKNRIAKNEEKDGKRYKKALREEAKVEDNALKTKMKELERLQKVHKQAAKDEAAAMASHSKAIKNEHKLDMTYHSARTKHESALADLKAKEDALNATKRHAVEQSQVLQEKQREIEELRRKKAVEDRERESKIKQLTTSPVGPTSS